MPKKLKLTDSKRPTTPRTTATTNNKKMSFKSQGTGCPLNHSRKSRDTWSNRQVWPWSTKWSRAKANRVLPREHADNSKHPFPTMQETTLHMYTPGGQYRNQAYHVLCSQRWRSSIQKAKTRLGLLIGKFRLKLKKVRKTTRPYRYDLNQIPYDYTVDIQGIRRGRRSAWRTRDRGLYPCLGGSDQSHYKEKEMQGGKIVVWGG